ncbi:Adenylosuccinate lyase protein [Dioscorea alata]|uniref:Adenylosuccinate lyase protein n=1 Tax=Dioscorea alata TaxID=55571 RepID=A0ACB7VUW6_DIOAL|nr:Adenylosuccinate lyase protein [Dioscorea alata]
MTKVPNFSENACSFLENIIHDIKFNDAFGGQENHGVMNHDVQAVENFLKFMQIISRDCQGA